MELTKAKHGVFSSLHIKTSWIIWLKFLKTNHEFPVRANFSSEGSVSFSFGQLEDISSRMQRGRSQMIFHHIEQMRNNTNVCHACFASFL